jgi:excisionase family DNA binding protein
MPSLPLMTAAEVATHLACSTDQIHALINRGRLTAVNIGSANRPCYRISPDALELFLDSMRTTPAPKPARRTKRKSLATVTEYF